MEIIAHCFKHRAAEGLVGGARSRLSTLGSSVILHLVRLALAEAVDVGFVQTSELFRLGLVRILQVVQLLFSCKIEHQRSWGRPGRWES